MSDMFFDTADFDFTSLTDVVGIDATPSAKTATPAERMNEYGGVVDDISDIAGDVSDYNSEVDDEETERKFNEGTSDLITPEQDDAGSINSIDDNTSFTLDDGSQLTGRDLKQLTREKEVINHRSQWLDAAYQAYAAETQDISYILEHNKIGVDMNVEYLENLINKERDDTRRGELWRDLRDAQNAQREVRNQAKEVMRKQQQRENQILDYQHAQTDHYLSKTTIPNFADIKGDLMQFATNTMGIPADRLDRLYCPGLVQALYESYRYRDQNKRAQEQTKAIKGKYKNAPSVASATAIKPAEERSNKAKQAIKNMGASRQANVNAFAFIKD